MKRKNKSKWTSVLAMVLIVSTLICLPTFAAENDSEKYYMGTLVNTGKDNGYSGNKKITKKDLHFDWKLGQFYVNGFSRVEAKHTDNPIIIKNTGDEVTLWFSLEQNINKLDGKKNLVINSDKNGYDEVFGVEKSDFGKGTLIIRHTNYQNKKGEPVIYRDYLAAMVSKDADTKVQLCEEGDYEVSLLYEVKDNGVLFFDSYENYRISFKFSVRNGNTMVFPFDVATKQELTNESFTPNGFYLDLANSHYLNVNVKKQILQEGAKELVEDTRFNRPAKDKETFTEEGLYTITVKNPTTGEETAKKIYVGTDDLLKAHVVTGLSISEIKAQMEDGAIINVNGTIDRGDVEVSKENSDDKQDKTSIVIGGIVLGLVVASTVIVVFGRKKRQELNNVTNFEQESNDE